MIYAMQRMAEDQTVIGVFNFPLSRKTAMPYRCRKTAAIASCLTAIGSALAAAKNGKSWYMRTAVY